MMNEFILVEDIVETALLCPSMFLRGLDYLSLSSNFDLNYDSRLYRFTCPISSIFNKEFGNLFISLIGHVDSRHYAIQILTIFVYLLKITAEYGIFTAFNVCLTGQIIGLIGTSAQYKYLKKIFTPDIENNPYLYLTTSYVENASSWIYDKIHMDLLIYGLDFPISSLMGVSFTLQIYNFVSLINQYRNSRIDTTNFLAKAGLSSISLILSFYGIHDNIFNTLSLFFSNLNYSSIISLSMEPGSRYGLSTGRTFSFLWGMIFGAIYMLT